MEIEDYLDPVVVVMTVVLWGIVTLMIFKGMVTAEDPSQYRTYQIVMSAIMLPVVWFFIERAVHR